MERTTDDTPSKTAWQDRYQQALHFAARAHDGQTYPGKTYSYLVHLGLVSMEIMAAIMDARAKGVTLDEDLAMLCSVLHDAIEDTAVTHADLEEAFGRNVADGVRALSKDDGIRDKSARMADSLARIKAQPREVWMVKMADRITNLQPPPEKWGQDKIETYRQEAMIIHNQLKEASGFLAARLLDKIGTYGK